ncbi:MAG: F0F1 ATP synthase subunit A [Armatimonadetes bacterium]|nr:F0F1 ATP synthase subunit A [Armatimonadota bacterium]PIU65527.1 MAG: ATP synthase F0 subunit A [Armatimonadetes bacterium CG07_land_8_20_14_0_80_59_28]PIX40141.1 MAG: ATP synthase F0 subunit A [Armatimonadetes bacterium CG_4_8_14_3_um_filter_58_9]PIY44293.1 MAG: ATP synthase F0 subunit A [Armatimonadetes bacterium CG_4_10_14_3_um_filter_59_10]
MSAGAEQVAQHGAELGGHPQSVFAHEVGTWFNPIAKALGLPNYIVVSWFIILALVVFAVMATRRLSLVPSKLQCVAELIVDGLNKYLASIIGADGPRYAPLISTLFVYILCLNLAGLIPGLVSPTAFPNTTIALALITFVSVQTIAIWKTGFANYVKHLCGEPLWLAPLAFPIHVIGELAKPLSLAFRLLGNIFGEDMVIVQLVAMGAAIMAVIHFPLPVQLPLMAFGLFTSFVQALVFATLGAIYIALFISHGDHEERHEAHARH